MLFVIEVLLHLCNFAPCWIYNFFYDIPDEFHKDETCKPHITLIPVFFSMSKLYVFALFQDVL